MKKLVLSAFKLQDKDNFAKKFEIFLIAILGKLLSPDAEDMFMEKDITKMSQSLE